MVETPEILSNVVSVTPTMHEQIDPYRYTEG